MYYDIVSLYYLIDEFCKLYEENERHNLIDTGRSRDRSGKMSLSEMVTIMVIFHMSPCRNFKFFYNGHLHFKHGKDFPNMVCYERFVQLMPRLFVPLSVILHSLMGENSGYLKILTVINSE